MIEVLCRCGKLFSTRKRSRRQGKYCSTKCGYEFRTKVGVNYKDLTGMVFGKLTVIRRVASNKHKRSVFLCRCECGNEKQIWAAHLMTRKNPACGCMIGKSNKRHGRTETRFYKIWSGMKDRTTRKLCPAYPKYGGRGIVMCDRWLTSFENFSADMFESYEDHVLLHGENDTTIERRDNDKGYNPENCSWATRKEQARNRKSSSLVVHNGVEMTVAEFAEILNQGQVRVGHLLRKGMSPMAVAARFGH